MAWLPAGLNNGVVIALSVAVLIAVAIAASFDLRIDPARLT